MMKKNITIKSIDEGDRLDAMVSRCVDDCSRSLAARYIHAGHIQVNANKKKPGYRVKAGEVVAVDIPDLCNDPQVLPEKIPLEVVFEDDHITVVNKGAGMVVHPAPGNPSGTLVNALLYRDPAIKDTSEDSFRPGIVHRLDKDTTGLMVVARTKRALVFLQKEFKQRRVEKRYAALVAGQLENSCGEMDLPIGRHPAKRKMMAVNHESGKSAITRWYLKEQYCGAAFVEILLKTGRTHQIRVHFYAMGHPLIGDPIYQPRRMRRKKGLAGRQMLHAGSLSFRHPYSGIQVSFTADPPQDFLETQLNLRKYGLGGK